MPAALSIIYTKYGPGEWHSAIYLKMHMLWRHFLQWGIGRLPTQLFLLKSVGHTMGSRASFFMPHGIISTSQAAPPTY